MFDVPAPTANRNETSGATSVICFGLRAINFAAIDTIQSIPPADCIIDEASTTESTMSSASTGGEPGARRNTNTRIATPAPPQSPRPTPLDRVPITIQPRTTRSCVTNSTISIGTPLFLLGLQSSAAHRSGTAHFSLVRSAASRGATFQR